MPNSFSCLTSKNDDSVLVKIFNGNIAFKSNRMGK